jgi:3-(3-hydroxy-phenyl)propionate hydroxylase
MDCDIAIIGYGPVGATAAALLGGQGLKVAVIERMAGVYDKPRAITADHEVMRCMQFAGIGQELGVHVRPHPGTRYLGVDGNTIRQTDVIPPPTRSAGRPASISSSRNSRRCCATPLRGTAI